MRELRKYRGYWDDGHDVGEFCYYSSHRNFSKKNMEDMKIEFSKTYGRNRLRCVKLEFGYLIKD